MSTSKAATIQKRTGTIVLLTSMAVSIGWVIGKTVNVYQYAWAGAIFELLWVPMLAGLIGLPIFSMYRLLKEKFSFRSNYLYAVMIIVLTVTIVSFIK